jgi:competence protein ComEA
MRQIVRAALIALAIALPTPTTTLFVPAAQAEAALIDINSASKDVLDTLPGIGPARADAIIKGRPYNGKDDLVNRHIIPQSVYDGIKERIIARQAGQKKK